MNVTELLGQATGRHFSIELLPPLKGNGTEGMFRTIDKMLPYGPLFINITTHHTEYVYRELPNGLLERRRVRRRPGTIAIAAAIQHRFNVPVIPHVICSGTTIENIEYELLDLQFLGISNLLLLRGDKAYRHKEWVLLSMYTWNVRMSNQESNTLNIAGTVLSRLMGMEWVPSYRFVHVVINGQYQGMYYLMETVDRGNSRIDISETGFLIEHDVFWWKEDVYFKTRRQRAATAFTFKYPDDSNVTDSTLQAVKGYMEDFEEALYSGGDIGAKPLIYRHEVAFIREVQAV